MTMVDPEREMSVASADEAAEATAGADRRTDRLAAVRRTVSPKTWATRRRRGRLSPAQVVVLGAAMTVTLLAGWMALYLTVLSAAVQAHDQAGLYSQFREQLADGTAPLGGLVEPGSPVALLDFPAAGISRLVVVEGTSSGDLMAGPGHRPDTVLPGQVGVSVLYGRQLAFGGPFAGVPRATPGATFTVVTGQGRVTFRVDRVRRAGDRLPPPLAAGGSRVTMVAAEAGSGLLGQWTPSSVVYLDATMVGKSEPRQAQVGSVPVSEQAMHGDMSALTLVLLWLQALILALGAGIWAFYRWGRPQTWLAAGGLAIAAVWGLSGAVATLLPNLL